MQPFVGKGTEWNTLISRLPGPHLLQSWQWAQVKSKYGWEPMPFVWEGRAGNRESLSAAVMVLMRTVLSRGFAARLCVLYCPKGPLMDWSDAPLRQLVLDDLQALARRQGAIFLKVDADIVLGTGVPSEPGARNDEHGEAVVSELRQRGWLFSSDQIQFRNTVWLDVSAPEAEMLARMKQKTRYNVRLAEKKGVRVRIGTAADLSLLYTMYAETSVRNGFVIREEAYYRTVWEAFMRQSPSSDHTSAAGSEPFAEPLIAEVEGETVAAIFVFYFAGRCYYLYGMSREIARERMPNYLLQWEAMKRARARGCQIYDLWGAPDEFQEGDPLWDVFRFKQGLGGQVVRTMGAWDYPASGIWYKTYTRLIPRILDVMRARGKQQTKSALE